jgi:ketosteroid isomerase-like protein
MKPRPGLDARTQTRHRCRVPVETIRRLYDALARRDGDAAAACYAGDAVFEDPAFGRLEGGAVKDMWRMLCERSDDLDVSLADCGMEGEDGWARWSAHYTFTRTGRPVHNEIRSRFRFDGDLIREQVDSFSLRRWGGQALGRRGAALGTAGLLGRAVRRQARGQLDEYRR